MAQPRKRKMNDGLPRPVTGGKKKKKGIREISVLMSGMKKKGKKKKRRLHGQVLGGGRGGGGGKKTQFRPFSIYGKTGNEKEKGRESRGDRAMNGWAKKGGKKPKKSSRPRRGKKKRPKRGQLHLHYFGGKKER